MKIKAEIKDKDFLVGAALRSIGFNIREDAVEMLLNVSDMVRENGGKITLKDVVEMETKVKKMVYAPVTIDHDTLKEKKE